jgi:hypothetical protein
MREAAQARGSEGAAERYDLVSTESEEAGQLIRDLIARLDVLTGSPDHVERIA